MCVLVASTGSRSADAEDGAAVGDRVLSQLLTEMDGLQARANVVVLAATNRPDRLDAALLRPGRFDRLLYVPPPDETAREEIFKVHLRATPTAPDVHPAALAAASDGYTGADIAAVCREAALAALDEDLGAAQVHGRHFQLALDRVPASAAASSSLLQMYSHFQRQGRIEGI